MTSNTNFKHDFSKIDALILEHIPACPLWSMLYGKQVVVDELIRLADAKAGSEKSECIATMLLLAARMQALRTLGFIAFDPDTRYWTVVDQKGGAA